MAKKMNSEETRQSSSSPLRLTRHDLTLNGVMDVARRGIAVEIEKRAASRLSEARKLLYDLMNEGIPIYGGNTGVGWNKDISVTQECLARFNANLLHSHAVGVKPYVTEEEARAILLIRLNTLLVGCTGIDPGILQMYVSFLNRGIIPLIPERGSVGQADIGCLSHAGLAMMGEGTVRYKGRDIPAMDALRAEGLSPVSLGPRDGLAIVSSNALASGQAAVALFEAEELIRASEIVCALSLEGVGGNTSSLNLKSHQLHGFEESASSALRISRYLEGSYIHKVREGRPLQDPLCYRNAAHLYDAAQRTLESARSALTIHFNHSDDNPCLLLDERAVVSCSNFGSLPWVLELETVTVVLSLLSKVCCMRAVKLANPSFTGLSRNLTPDTATIAFSTIQKTFSSLDAEIRLLANPVTMDTFSLAGGMEDISTNAPLVAQKIKKSVDNLRYIVAIELILACQAMDLRGEKELGMETAAARACLREVVGFYEKDDHCITDDIYAAYEVLKSGPE